MRISDCEYTLHSPGRITDSLVLITLSALMAIETVAAIFMRKEEIAVVIELDVNPAP